MPKKLLIVEDDPDILFIMQYILESEGFQVSTSPNSKFIRDINQIQPDLILLDNNLTDGYGSELCRQLKADPLTSNIKVILISASHDLETLAAKSGADFFLHKPFDTSVLAQVAKKFTSDD